MDHFQLALCVFSISFVPASAAELIRCPDAASLMAAAVQASAAPKADFATLVSPRAATAPGTASAAVAQVSTAPLDPMGILAGSKPAKSTAPALPGAAGAEPATGGAGCAYVIQAGDTLGRVAATKLGNANRWNEIATVNPGLNANALVPGRQIQLPCGAAQPAVAGAASLPAGAAPVRTLVAPGAAQNAPAGTHAATPVVAPVPPAVVLPVWSARSGEYFSDVVKRWAKSEGYSVVFSTTADWKLAVSVSERGTFEDVLDRLAKGLGANGRPPFIQLFPNKVIKIGGGA